MDKYIFDESNGLWYERQGDYYIPCLTLPAEEQPIGLWGRRHLRYIKEYRKARYTSLLLSGKLNSCLLYPLMPTCLHCKNKPRLFLPKFPCLAYKQRFRYNNVKIKSRRFHHGQQPVR